MGGKMSAAKGAKWERDVGAQLSLWISKGHRDDLFARAVSSGGRFTVRKTRAQTTAQPGDLVAAHEDAFPFLRLFMVECKHKANIGIEAYAFDEREGKSFIAATIKKAREEADHAGLHWMVIAKQNQRPPLVFMHGAFADHARRSAPANGPAFPSGHLFHRREGINHGILCLELERLAGFPFKTFESLARMFKP